MTINCAHMQQEAAQQGEEELIQSHWHIFSHSRQLKLSVPILGDTIEYEGRHRTTFLLLRRRATKLSLRCVGISCRRLYITITSANGRLSVCVCVWHVLCTYRWPRIAVGDCLWLPCALVSSYSSSFTLSTPSVFDPFILSCVSLTKQMPARFQTDVGRLCVSIEDWSVCFRIKLAIADSSPWCQ